MIGEGLIVLLGFFTAIMAYKTGYKYGYIDALREELK